MRKMNGIMDSMDMSLRKLWEFPLVLYPSVEGYRGLVHCSPWGHKEVDMT